MNERQFKQESETIMGRIRDLKIQGLLHDENAETAIVEQKRINAAIQWGKVDEMNYKLTSQEYKTQIAAVQADIDRDNLFGTEATRAFNQAKWQLKGEEFDLTLEEMRNKLNDKRTELNGYF